MPWSVSVDRSLGVITTVYSGTLSRAELAPREVRKKPELLREFQSLLGEQGVPIAWPKLTPR